MNVPPVSIENQVENHTEHEVETGGFVARCRD